MLHKILQIALIGILLALVGCNTAAPPTPEPTPTVTSSVEGTITLGKVSDAPAEKIEEYQPIANYLAANLSDLGINVGKVMVAQDMETMADWLATGQVDLFFDNPYAAQFVSDHGGGQPFLVRVKEGEEEKHAVFFSLADSPITSLEDLTEQVVAFEEPDSGSGFMLPLIHLLEMGMMNPVEVIATDTAVAADQVGYIFSLDDDNTIQWVVNNRVMAGVVDNDAFEEYTEESPDKLRILAETESILRHQLTIVRPNMEPVLQETIKTLLLGLDKTAEAQAVLGPSETEQFDELDGEWSLEVTRSQEMYAQMKDNRSIP